MASKRYQHWKVVEDDSGIRWLHLDQAESNANVLSASVLLELDAELDRIAAKPPKGVVILSDKDSGFIAGADITEFTSFESEEQAIEAIQRGQTILNKLAQLPCTTVAVIHGFCLGGGLELALACNYRVADNDPKTKLGLPEIKLGIHPGFGGTLRLIKQIGAIAALDNMLTGRAMSARAAKKVGVVDYAVPKRHLLNAARGILNNPPKQKKLALWKTLVSHRFARPWITKLLVKKVSARAPRAHYPAPYALIDLWLHHFDDPERMLQEEAASVARLMMGNTSQNLIRVFGLQEQLKGLGRSDGYEPKHIHVIGGGVMGGDIAAWCALQGFKVTIQDRKHETLAKVLQRAFALYKKRLKQPRLIKLALDRLVPDLKGDGLVRADIIIEAIFEDAEVKRALYKSIEPKIKPDALIATNTSSIPLEDLSSALKHPERLVGLHFFNPVAMMPLVEIVVGTSTSDETKQKAAIFTKKISRLPLPVKSSHGFLVNRILMPYLIEAVILAEEGVPLKVIDQTAVDFGMPMGPIELADTVGLDICFKVADILSQHMDIDVPDKLRRMVNSNNLGKKTGKGFYTFKRGKPVKPSIPKDYTPPSDLQERLMMRMVNEAVACLRDGVVESADLIDAGVIFGTGFAPFRGGPLHYVDSRGNEQLTKILEHLQQLYGPRFSADSGWQQLQKSA